MSRFTRALTPAEARRIRLHLALIPLYAWLLFTWIGYFQSVSTPGRLDEAGLIKGHDFVHFFVLGEIALERRPEELYSFTDQAVRTDRLSGYENRYVPAYGPQVAILFAPLAMLPYDAAWAVWSALSALIYGLSCYALWRSQPALRPFKWPMLVASVAYPPFSMLIGFGHISALALAAFVAAYLAVRAQRHWLAGFALGCVFVKPPLGLILPVVLLYGREWRMVGGAAVAVVLQLVAAWVYFGPGAILDYAQATSQLGRFAADLEPQPDQMQSLRSFFSALLPWPTAAFVAYLVTSVAAIAVAARCWRTAAPLELRYAILLLAAILINPHVNVYDLVVIVPVFVLATAWAIEASDGGLSSDGGQGLQPMEASARDGEQGFQSLAASARDGGQGLQPLAARNWPLAICLYASYYSAIFAFAASAYANVQVSVALLVVLLWMLARRTIDVDPKRVQIDTNHA